MATALTEMMKAAAALLSAIAWPTVAILFGYFFRAQIRDLLVTLPGLVNRVEKFKVSGIEAELSGQAAVVASAGVPDKSMTVDPAQRAAAARVQAEAKALPLTNISSIVDDLANEYERVRGSGPSSHQRTLQMVQVVAKMRTIALAASPLLAELQQSASAGHRLAAIVILQLQPRIEQAMWLGSRFGAETPFVFYHAGVALLQTATRYRGQYDPQILVAVDVAETALRAFDGQPDQNSLEVLAETRQLLGETAPR